MKFERETKIGIFTIVALTALYFGYNFLRGKKFFANVGTYHVVYNNIEGVVKSTPVYYKGLKVGQVDKLMLLDADTSNRILATLSIDAKIKLSKASTAMIVSQDLLGAKAIYLDIPNLLIPLNNNDTLIGKEQEDLSTIISNIITPIKDKSERVLVSIDKVLNDVSQILNDGGKQKLSSGISDLSGTLYNLKLTSVQLNNLVTKESANIGKTIENFENLSSHLNGSSANLAKTVDNIKSISDSLAVAPTKQTIENLEKLSRELNTLVAKINNGDGTLGKLANDSTFYINLNKSAYELQSLLQDFQKYPARYVNISVFGSNTKKAEKQHNNELKKKSKK